MNKLYLTEIKYKDNDKLDMIIPIQMTKYDIELLENLVNSDTNQYFYLVRINNHKEIGWRIFEHLQAVLNFQTENKHANFIINVLETNRIISINKK